MNLTWNDSLLPELKQLLEWVASECFGKEKFATQQIVQRAMDHMSGRRINTYRCPCCHQWHIGAAPPKSAIRAKRR